MIIFDQKPSSTGKSFMFHRLWIKSIKEKFFSLSTQYVKISTKIVHRSSIISQRSWNINSNMSQHVYCVKSVQIRSFSWSVFSCIRTRTNSVFGHFLRSARILAYFTQCLEQLFSALI